MTGVLDLVIVDINSSQVVNYALSRLKTPISITRCEVPPSLSFCPSVNVDYLVVFSLKVVRVPLELAFYFQLPIFEFRIGIVLKRGRIRVLYREGLPSATLLLCKELDNTLLAGQYSLDFLDLLLFLVCI
jgi:hypothetical protein